MYKILIIFIGLCASISAQNYCHSPQKDTLYIYPNPKNCSTYFACINSDEYEYECLQAPQFIWTDEKVCMDRCSTVATTRRASTKSSPSELPPDPILYPDTPARTIICPLKGSTKAIVAQSCTDYIECYAGVGTKKSCPSGQEFSPSRYECVPESSSDCSKQKPKGSHHIKCRYDKGAAPIYFPSDTCAEFKKCANQFAWEVKCAQNCNWNNDAKTCDWANNFPCNLESE